jgi:hypothetical protein
MRDSFEGDDGRWGKRERGRREEGKKLKRGGRRGEERRGEKREQQRAKREGRARKEAGGGTRKETERRREGKEEEIPSYKKLNSFQISLNPRERVPKIFSNPESLPAPAEVLR